MFRSLLTPIESVVATLEAERPEVCVVDSVQVLYDPGLTGAPGSVSLLLAIGRPRAHAHALRDVQAPRVERLGTGIGEFDRVLGGGSSCPGRSS